MVKSIKGLFKKRTGKNLKAFAGDDCTLIYWVECLDCGTIIKADNSDSFCLTDWKCPTCIKQDNFKFEYFTKEFIDSLDGGREFINTLKKINKKDFE